jgi:hypothetical protein
MVEMVHDRIAAGEPFQRLLYCDVESKWKNHITTFPGQSLSPKLDLVWKRLWTCHETNRRRRFIGLL